MRKSSLQKPTPVGAKYDHKNKKIIIDEEQVKKDENIKADRRTANLMTIIANTIDNSIVMEAAVPSDFPNNKMPLLNSQVWIEDTIDGPQIRFEHFQKPMASKLEIPESSAISDQTKRSSLVQGGITRLLNTSIELGESKQQEILSQYMKKLQTSGYKQEYRVQILKSILKGWKKILEKAETGERPLHRNREFEKEKRKSEKENKKNNWFSTRYTNWIFTTNIAHYLLETISDRVKSIIFKIGKT